MRHFTRKVASLTIVLAVAAMGQAQNVGQGRGRQNGLNLATMAQQIFDQSDRNHNNLLSRTEFSTAQLLTDNTVAQLGRSGLIGRGTTPVLARLPAGPLGQGGMLGQQGGLFNLQITNTNRVTQPQFTNYFQNAVARGDAAWRQMYAMNRSTNGRAYPRYGRGYGHSPYRNYGYGGYRPSVMAAGYAMTPTTGMAHNSATTGSTSAGTHSSNSAAGTGAAAGTTNVAPGVNIVGGGNGITTAVGGNFNANNIGHHHKTGNTTASHKTASSAGKGTKTGSFSLANTANQNARARVTAMAQSRALARRASASGGGGGGGGGAYHGGGGFHGGGGYHGGGGGGGGHGGGGHGGGHHR